MVPLFPVRPFVGQPFRVALCLPEVGRQGQSLAYENLFI